MITSSPQSIMAGRRAKSSKLRNIMAKQYTKKIYEEAGSPVDLVIPEGYTAIGPQTFKNVKEKLKSVVFPDSITSIPSDLLCECKALVKVVLPEGLKSIGANAFYGCTALKSINIPEKWTSIPKGLFSNCSSLQVLPIPESVTKIGEYAFSGCKSLQKINIPDGITEICKGVFRSCSSLQSINIPKSVTSIGCYAFDGCSHLLHINIPESVTEIGYCAFDDCPSLRSINMPEGITKIEYSVFHRCSSLQSIIIPESVIEIGEYAFGECTSLQNVNIPNNVNKICKRAFKKSSALQSITIPESVTEIGEQAFEDCTSLQSVTIPEGVKKIEDSVFCGCSSLSSVILPESVEEIGRYAFCACTSLQSIQLPENVGTIGDHAFQGCSSLHSINIPENVFKIGHAAFAGCNLDNLTIDTCHFTLNHGLLIAKDWRLISSAFSKCSSIIIPDQVTEIEEYAFNKCTSLQSITIPSSVAKIGQYAFSSCSSLHCIDLLNPNIKMSKYSFYNCEYITEVKLPKGLTWGKVKDKFEDSPWGKTRPVSPRQAEILAKQAAEKAKKEKLEAMAAASASVITKIALDEVAPQSSTSIVNTENQSITLCKDLIDGIKLQVTFNSPKNLDEMKQFASYLAEYVRRISNFFVKCFTDSSNEQGYLVISSKEDNLEISVKLGKASTKGGNYVDMEIKEVNLKKFVKSLNDLTEIIEKFDGWEGVKGGVNITGRRHRKKIRFSVDLTEVDEAPKNLVIINCINSMNSECFKNCRAAIESATIPRKLLFNANAFDGCRSLKTIHIV